jgi:translation initiation factor IF-3
MLGVIPTQQAKGLASQCQLDLVEVSPNADPPVCRIMDYGKYRYEEQRKERLAKKRQHNLSLKEIKFHANVEEHDYQTKLSHIREFLGKGHKVKISLFFRGRENAHRDLGFQVIERVTKDCEPIATVESRPRLIGRGIFGVLSPIAPKPSK